MLNTSDRSRKIQGIYGLELIGPGTKLSDANEKNEILGWDRQV